MSDDAFDLSDIDALLNRLEDLKIRHRDLDTRIEEMECESVDSFELMTLKRERLRLKDRIAWLSSRLTPDIIA